MSSSLESQIKAKVEEISSVAFMLADQKASLRAFGPGFNMVESYEQMLQSAIAGLTDLLALRYVESR